MDFENFATLAVILAPPTPTVAAANCHVWSACVDMLNASAASPMSSPQSTNPLVTEKTAPPAAPIAAVAIADATESRLRSPVMALPTPLKLILDAARIRLSRFSVSVISFWSWSSLPAYSPLPLLASLYAARRRFNSASCVLIFELTDPNTRPTDDPRDAPILRFAAKFFVISGWVSIQPTRSFRQSAGRQFRSATIPCSEPARARPASRLSGRM